MILLQCHVPSFNFDDRTGKHVVGRESNHEPVHQANPKISKNKQKGDHDRKGDTRCLPTQVAQVLKPGVAARIQGKFGG